MNMETKWKNEKGYLMDKMVNNKMNMDPPDQRDHKNGWNGMGESGWTDGWKWVKFHPVCENGWNCVLGF